MLHPIQPGWDSATLISGYETDTVQIDSTQATCDVTYHVIARIAQNSQGPYLIFGPEKKTTLFDLEQTPWGWRIARPNQHPHILPQVIINRLSKEDQEKLQSYLTECN